MTTLALNRWQEGRHALALMAGIGLLVLVEHLARPLAPLARMVVLVSGGLGLVKALVWLRTQPRLCWAAGLAFVLWPGMDPAPFAQPGRVPRQQIVKRGRDGGLFLLLGLAICVGLQHGAQALPLRVVSLLALVAASLVLHFGLLGLLTAVLWRLGYPVQPLFDRPLLATQLGDFWGRRWNRAFSDMLRILLLRPLRGTVPRPVLVVGGFLLSGLLHELAITVPVLAGWGGPMAYFALHGGLVLLERHQGPGWLFGWRARIWTLGWLLVPLPWLFHTDFITQVLLPLLGVEL